jgi:hypothetical protein
VHTVGWIDPGEVSEGVVELQVSGGEDLSGADSSMPALTRLARAVFVKSNETVLIS